MACPKRVTERGPSTKHAPGPETDVTNLEAWNVQNSTPNATVSDVAPDPSEVFHASQAMDGTGTTSFGRIRNETNSLRLTGSLAGQQNAEFSGINHKKQPPQPEGIQWNDIYPGSNSIVEFALSDLLYQPVLKASSFDNTSCFDHDFDFDFELHSNRGADSNVSSHPKEPGGDPKGETVNQNLTLTSQKIPPADLNGLYWCSTWPHTCTPSNRSLWEAMPTKVISHTVPALDGVGLRSPGYETPITASMIEMQPLEDCLEPTEANLKALEIRTPTNGLDHGSVPSEPKAPTTSSSMTSATTS